MEATRQLKILTHNMQCHYFTRSPNKWERMQKFLEYVEEYDILLLQELFTVSFFGYVVTTLKDWIIQEAKSKGFLHHAVPSTSQFGQDSGLLILSKFPITTR